METLVHLENCEELGATCVSCEEHACDASDFNYSDFNQEERLCETCYYEDLSDGASVVHLLTPGASEMAKYYLGEYRAIDEYGDPIYHIRRKYHKTDAWRGYYETSVDGTIEYDAGADLWGESTDIRTLAERLHDDFKNGVLPIPVYIVTDPTSNVFAIAMSVLIAPRDKETLDLWLNGEYVEED